MDKLSELNNADDERAISIVAPLIERAPEVAKRVALRRPFQSADDIKKAIRTELRGLSEPELVDLFRAHPELAPKDPAAMTNESQSEQGRLNLTSQSSVHRSRLTELNAQYRGKFGFPFITALVRHPDMDSVLSEFETRLSADRASEIEESIDQIATVSSSRVSATFGSNDPDAARSAAGRN